MQCAIIPGKDSWTFSPGNEKFYGCVSSDFLEVRDEMLDSKGINMNKTKPVYVIEMKIRGCTLDTIFPLRDCHLLTGRLTLQAFH